MKLRLYSVVNQYINGLHAGIQTAHAISNMMYDYGVNHRPQDRAVQLCDQWARVDKTIIVLEGGYQSNLERIFKSMKEVRNLPSAKFHEEPDALNGALTAVCVVLPEYMYKPQYNTSRGHPFDDPYCQPHPAYGLTEYRDPESGELIHKYTEEEHSLIANIKALRLKGA